MDLGEGRLIGNYIVGARIGWGSFSVVWRARHRQSGMEVAVKEIDKKQFMTTKVGDNLLKEISILSNVRHPNIIRLLEAIQTEDRIYLILEYCEGGDLAAYLHRHGRVSEAVARHFMRQLAAGLQVLNENCLIHRDLKPQNLLLSTNEATPLLKIGDFGFARYVTPQGLADTLCGSPLYMAPEIIQNKKYNSKADLWSAGAILFQLVTGKPPFEGDTQLQLFQNILTFGELRFPQGALEELHPDCVHLCRSLLRQNPVERLTFEEFFNHKFLQEPKNSNLVYPSVHVDDSKIQCRKDVSASSSKGVDRFMPNIVWDMPRTSLEGYTNLSDPMRVTDSMESIEKEYVLVNPHFASTGTFSCSLETSLLYSSARKKDLSISVAVQTKEAINNSICRAKDLFSHGSIQIAASSSTSNVLKEVQGLPILHPSTRLHLLRQYICVLSELAQLKVKTKMDEFRVCLHMFTSMSQSVTYLDLMLQMANHLEGLYLESFSVELVVLAIWKEAIQVCNSWRACIREDDLRGTCSANEAIHVKEGAGLSPHTEENVDFSRPQSVSKWAEQGFVVAVDRADNLSLHVQHTDGNAQMPDAMEIIFQTALDIGKSGGVDELMGNKGRAAAAYSKAELLLSFIVGEATSLPLNPRFLLTPADRERIMGYIDTFKSHHFSCQKSQVSLE